MPEDPVVYEPSEPEVKQATVPFLHTQEYPVHKLRDLSQIDDKTWELISELMRDCEFEMTEALLTSGVKEGPSEYFRGIVYLAREVLAMRARAKQLLRDIVV